MIFFSGFVIGILLSKFLIPAPTPTFTFPGIRVDGEETDDEDEKVLNNATSQTYDETESHNSQ